MAIQGLGVTSSHLGVYLCVCSSPGLVSFCICDQLGPGDSERNKEQLTVRKRVPPHVTSVLRRRSKGNPSRQAAESTACLWCGQKAHCLVSPRPVGISTLQHSSSHYCSLFTVIQQPFPVALNIVISEVDNKSHFTDEGSRVHKEEEEKPDLKSQNHLTSQLASGFIQAHQQAHSPTPCFP